MHFCTAKIRLAGNVGMEVVRDAFNPVSYPEVDVLRSIHGDDAVLDVQVIAETEQTARDEKERLVLKYGSSAVEAVYPGRSPRMELTAPKASIDPDLQWNNPLDREVVGFDSDPTVREEKALEAQTKAKTRQTKTRVLTENPFE
jgi:hypothetical protein